jgi:hypothetical protein
VTFKIPVKILNIISLTYFSIGRDLTPLESFGYRELPVCFADEDFRFHEHFLNSKAGLEETVPLQVHPDHVMVMVGDKDEKTDRMIDYLVSFILNSQYISFILTDMRKGNILRPAPGTGSPGFSIRGRQRMGRWLVCLRDVYHLDRLQWRTWTIRPERDEGGHS